MYRVELSDRRNIILYEKLKELRGAKPFLFNENNETNNDAGKTGNDIVIFSPARKLNAPEAKSFKKSMVIIGGAQPPEAVSVLKENGVTYKNLMDDEEYVLKNSKLTAENTLYLLIEATENSIYKNNILILGRGRLGKALDLLFNKLGLNVTLLSFNECATGRLKNFDVIINTVPAQVLSDNYLKELLPETAIIELASIACVDTLKIAGYPVKYIKGPGLPAKYCPLAAAEAMLKAILTLSGF